MSACHCCQEPGSLSESDRRPYPVRVSLFNRVTALLLTGWLVIVFIAVELAGTRVAGAGDMSTAPTLELFLRYLLG